jgi:hypothetical protein
MASMRQWSLLARIHFNLSVLPVPAKSAHGDCPRPQLMYQAQIKFLVRNDQAAFARRFLKASFDPAAPRTIRAIVLSLIDLNEDIHGGLLPRLPVPDHHKGELTHQAPKTGFPYRPMRCPTHPEKSANFFRRS